MRRPSHEIEQGRSLEWLARAHAASEATKRSLDESAERDFEERLRKVLLRCACGPDKIAKRGHVLADVGRTNFREMAVYDVSEAPRGKGTGARAAVFDEVV